MAGGYGCFRLLGGRVSPVTLARIVDRGDLGLPFAAMVFDPSHQTSRAQVFFDRHELGRILSLYGRMVAAGEWRDYGVGATAEACIFSIFHRASEAPVYRIEKRPALARRQGAWAIIGQGGLILRRGHELDQVLRFFDKGRFKVVD